MEISCCSLFRTVLIAWDEALKTACYVGEVERETGLNVKLMGKRRLFLMMVQTANVQHLMTDSRFINKQVTMKSFNSMCEAGNPLYMLTKQVALDDKMESHPEKLQQEGN